MLKVINSINTCYQQQLDSNEELRRTVDDIIKNNKEETWFYFSRIKPPESFALKIETGRVDIPTELEDFFACTIVVENSIEIKKAIELINHFFDVIERRPNKDSFTFKPPESFPYDDLRLYVTLKHQDGLPPESSFNKLSKVKFEIQIKTFLQHAWTKATHNLIYKGEEISWAKRRIAYQIKAMLEHAEISIHEIEKIKESDMLEKMNKTIKELNETKTFLTKNWNADTLPVDLTRISESISGLLKQLKVSIAELQGILDEESNVGRGINTSNLSPYFIVIQTIINQNPQKIKDFFSDDTNASKIVIPTEIDTGGLTLNEDKIIHI